MSREILSQDEIDSLLRGVESGEIGAGEAAPVPGARPFDFRSQERIIRGRMPGLEVANERFARFFRNSVSGVLQRFADVTVRGVAMVKFGDFLKELPLPSSINVIRMRPLRGFALFVIEAPTVFAFVECFFGGAAVRHTKAEGRQFTAIEQRVVRKVVDLALADMAEAWKGLATIAPEYVTSEIDPRFVTIVQPPEIVIRVDVQVEIEGFAGRMALAIPYSVVEPLKENLLSAVRPETSEADERWIAGLTAHLLDVPVEVVAQLGTTTLPLCAVGALAPGHVIHLGVPVGEGVVVKVEGVPKFRGAPGIHRGAQAVRLTEIL